MIDCNGKRICDREIKEGGSKPWRWKSCKAPATVQTPSKVVSHMVLDYCSKHAPKGQTS